MTHRGPDDAGFFVDGAVGLGHRRLSIIDLSPAGHQPMISRDENAIIVFNGEIYNFQALRRDLEKNRYPFRGGSDTEVILALYTLYGVACFQKLNGMFAVAIYDKAKSEIVLVRDRMGKKPLYWVLIDETLLFGSELKSLMAHPAFRKDIDAASLGKYLAYDYIPTPHTIFKDVYKLEPGTSLVYRNGQIQKEQFWDIRFDTDSVARDVAKQNKTALLQELDKRLEHAVVSRLVSDVPLGVFLSGGLDSSTIAYYAQKHALRPTQTFSIAFEEKSFDESRYARQVAQFLGTSHHEEALSAKDCLDLIPKVASFLDEPMADYSIIPTYLLSQFTRKHVTVALGGDGGDELFLGYPTFQVETVFPLLGAAKPLLTFLSTHVPVSHKHFNLQFKIHQLLQGLDVPERYRHHAWMGTFIGESRIQNPESRTFEDIDRYWEYVKHEPRWNQLVYLYLRTYLMDQVLVKVDRASMAASLEVRAPFLDYEFVDFVNSIPSAMKRHGMTGKYLLKELMKDKLPREIVYRKKQGFGVPLGAWFAKELKPFVQETLSRDRLQTHGLFDVDAVRRIMAEHMDGKADRRKQLWSLLVFQLWHERWMV